ncbi:MAG: T9SS type A sorting domain-containing protein, partial [Bacteroidota bacterium]
PNSFYSGNTKEEPFVGLRENYYSWEWGNALFIVLDPFWYTQHKPDWGWTLGEDQYNWFKNVLATSHAKFKFVFCHNLLGGKGNDARGGAEYAGLFEMGGSNNDSTWGFDTYRPGWEKPINTLMAENNTTIFFHGHDHFFGKQEKDGIVYQEVPQPSNRNITNISAAQYGYINGTFLPGRGYLLVTLADSSVKVDYISTYLPNEENANHTNGDHAFSYSIRSSANGVEENNEIPTSFQLQQNYPNPFDQETYISYRITTASHVQLKVYDVFGMEVISLVDQYQQAGTYKVLMNADEANLNRGIYFYKINTGNFSSTLKMVCSRQKG